MPFQESKWVGDWRLTQHAARRAEDRGISEAELLSALDRPEIVYPQDQFGPGREVRQRGRVGVVVHPMTRVVITVVFRTHEQWQHHLALGGAA